MHQSSPPTMLPGAAAGRRLLAGLLGLLLLTVSGPAAPAAADPARIVDATQYPFSAIGRVNSAGRNFCTGFLVSSRTLLTAAHCLYDLRQGRWYAPEEVHFVAGYQRDSWLAHSRAASYTVAEGYDPKRPPDMETAVEDWAVVAQLGLQIAAAADLRDVVVDREAERVVHEAVFIGRRIERVGRRAVAHASTQVTACLGRGRLRLVEQRAGRGGGQKDPAARRRKIVRVQ